MLPTLQSLSLRPLKRLAKKALYASVFDEILQREFEQTDDFCVVQIGANDGIQFDNLYEFVTRNRCPGLVVEPLSYYFKKLTEHYQAYPEVKPVHVAIHATERRCKLHYVNPESLAALPEWSQGIGSFDPSHHARANIPADAMTSEEVPCVHLMELFRMHDIDRLGLLQIDVEGYDYEVVNMIDFNVIKPLVIKYERRSLALSQKLSVATKLKRNGYRLHREQADTIAVLKDDCR